MRISPLYYLMGVLVLLTAVGSMLRPESRTSTVNGLAAGADTKYQSLPLTTSALFPIELASSDTASIEGDDIRFEIERITLLSSVNDVAPERDLLLFITGRLLADEQRCVYQADFRVKISGSEYEIATEWMDVLKAQAGNSDYPGPQFSAQCIDADRPEATYLVFDLPLTYASASFQFFEGEIMLGSFADRVFGTSMEQAESSALTRPLMVMQDSFSAPGETPATAEPAVSISVGDYATRRSVNLRACPRTTCEILVILDDGQRLLKVAERQGTVVNESALWYQVRLDDGLTGFVHSTLLIPVNQ